MTNKEKALALISTFASGDTMKARELLAEGYIQHNLAYGTGRDAFVGAVEYLASAPVKTTVNNVRAFEDGDKVFLQTIYNFAGAGEQVAFDIFRFDSEGKIAEHWDNLATKTEGDNYIQHNTAIADGLSGLGAALEALAKQGIQMIYNKTYFVLADGDYALAVSEGTFGGVATSFYDLFRVENGKIAEHWDVMETIADKKTWKNQNGKF